MKRSAGHLDGSRLAWSGSNTTALMNLISNRTRVTIAVSAVILAGIVALIFRAVDNETPEAQTPASFDAQPDLVDEQLPTTSPEPTEEPTTAPRRRTGGGGRAPVGNPEPNPGPTDLSPLNDLPAVPDPRPVDPGEL